MSEEKKETTVKVPKVEKSRRKEPFDKTVMYVGPTIAGRITGNTTFKNGKPKAVEEIVQKYPYFEKLFVPLGEIADARRQLADKDSYLAVLYKKAKTIKE